MNTTPITRAAPDSRYHSPWRWWICLLLMFATVVNYMDRMALNQTARRIKTSLELNNEQYSWLESVFSFAFAVGAIGTGFIVDRVSVRRVYPLLVLGWSAAGVLTGFANGFWMLLGCRAALGLFESGNWPCGLRTTRAGLRQERSFGNSLFQSGTALGAVITPLLVLALLRWAESDRTDGTQDPDAWKFPFRVIGCFGLVWILLWFLTVPSRFFTPTETGPASKADGATRFVDVLTDRRFWVLLVMVITVNTAWHGYRTWLPLYLQEQRHFSEAAMSRFTSVYYLVADVGSWTAGLGTLLLCRTGIRVHGARTIAYAVCSLMTLCSIAVPFLPDGIALEAGLLVVAFGALGLFPTYFALTQDLSAKHQGKVTGTLGASAHLSLALIYPLEGRLIDITKSYEVILGGIGAAPLLALILMLAFWPSEKAKNQATATSPR